MDEWLQPAQNTGAMSVFAQCPAFPLLPLSYTVTATFTAHTDSQLQYPLQRQCRDISPARVPHTQRSASPARCVLPGNHVTAPSPTGRNIVTTLSTSSPISSMGRKSRPPQSSTGLTMVTVTKGHGGAGRSARPLPHSMAQCSALSVGCRAGQEATYARCFLS